MDIREFSFNLQKLYQEMSQAFSNFQSSTGLKCLNGCGGCCSNPEIEASTLEMVPMALKIYDEGKMEEWLSHLATAEQNSCLAYEGKKDGLGRCVFYDERPSVCRMFGVAGHYNKYHEVTLSICRYIKEYYGKACENAQESAKSSNTPMLSDWSIKLSSLDPQLVQNRLPINQAIKNALHKVALHIQYLEDDSPQ